jgi:hypothetical protein
METAQENEALPVPTEVDPLARPRLGAEAVRASLEAVRVAQVAARARARRETRWARLITVGALSAMGVTAWAAAHRPARARTVAAAAPVVAAQAPAVEVPPSIAPPAIEVPAVERPAAVPVVPQADKPAMAAATGSAEQVAPCDEAFAQRSWSTIASTCAAAFQARPQDSALAMRVAQAEHRRGHVATAADWARKALAIDAEIPEAFVIVARAEVAAGHARAGADAYQRYLALAPRGWHAAEARRALRAAR